MIGFEGVAGILSGVSVALSLLAVWLCQMIQKRVAAVSAEMITDHLRLADDLNTIRKEFKTLREECVGRAHYLEQRARESLH